jgi:hypothetical protein
MMLMFITVHDVSPQPLHVQVSGWLWQWLKQPAPLRTRVGRSTPLAGCWCVSGRLRLRGPAIYRAAQQQHLQQQRRVMPLCLQACSWSGWWGGTTRCVCHRRLPPSALAVPQQSPPTAAQEALAVSCCKTLSAFCALPTAAVWLSNWRSCGRTQVLAVSVHTQRRLSHFAGACCTCT